MKTFESLFRVRSLFHKRSLCRTPRLRKKGSRQRQVHLMEFKHLNTSYISHTEGDVSHYYYDWIVCFMHVHVPVCVVC